MLTVKDGITDRHSGITVCCTVGISANPQMPASRTVGPRRGLRNSQKATRHLLPSPGSRNKSQTVFTLPPQGCLFYFLRESLLRCGGGWERSLCLSLCLLITLNCPAFWFIEGSIWVLPISARLCWCNRIPAAGWYRRAGSFLLTHRSRS